MAGFPPITARPRDRSVGSVAGLAVLRGTDVPVEPEAARVAGTEQTTGPRKLAGASRTPMHVKTTLLDGAARRSALAGRVDDPGLVDRRRVLHRDGAVVVEGEREGT
jgi:hypothetical protein